MPCLCAFALLVLVFIQFIQIPKVSIDGQNFFFFRAIKVYLDVA